MNETLVGLLRGEASLLLGDFARFDAAICDPCELLLSIVSKIKGIRSVLWLARVNRFVSSVNIEVLDREYAEVEFFFDAKIRFLQEEKTKTITAPQEKRTVSTEASISNGTDNASLLISHGTVHHKRFLNDKNGIQKKNIERHRLIIDVLGKKDKASIKDITRSFNDIGQKTIQRDLNELIKKDTIQRTGDRRWAMYSLKKIEIEN